MPPRLLLNPEAEADLVEAFAWYEGQRPGLGSEFFAEVAQVPWIPTSLPSRPSCTGNGTLNGGRCGADA